MKRSQVVETLATCMAMKIMEDEGTSLQNVQVTINGDTLEGEDAMEFILSVNAPVAEMFTEALENAGMIFDPE